MFKKDQYTHFKDVVYVFSKDVGHLGDKMTYKVNQEDILAETPMDIKFETFHYDDFIQIDVFHKGSVQNNSKLGKAFINIRDLYCKSFEDDLNKSANSRTFMNIPITFKPSNYGEKRQIVNG